MSCLIQKVFKIRRKFILDFVEHILRIEDGDFSLSVRSSINPKRKRANVDLLFIFDFFPHIQSHSHLCNPRLAFWFAFRRPRFYFRHSGGVAGLSGGWFFQIPNQMFSVWNTQDGIFKKDSFSIRGTRLTKDNEWYGRFYLWLWHMRGSDRVPQSQRCLYE